MAVAFHLLLRHALPEYLIRHEEHVGNLAPLVRARLAEIAGERAILLWDIAPACATVRAENGHGVDRAERAERARVDPDYASRFVKATVRQDRRLIHRRLPPLPSPPAPHPAGRTHPPDRRSGALHGL